MTNSQIRKTFSSRKRKGDITNLVSLFDGKYSQPHVSNVLAGRRNNTEILNKAYKLVSRRKLATA
jgi:hypothetical protein